MFQGRAERPANAFPVCWTVWGTRRDSWIVDSDPENGLTSEVVRDIFGFQITEETWVITNVWFEGDEYHEQRSIQQVDYSHGLHLQHRASLDMYPEVYDCELQDVVAKRKNEIAETTDATNTCGSHLDYLCFVIIIIILFVIMFIVLVVIYYFTDL